MTAGHAPVGCGQWLEAIDVYMTVTAATAPRPLETMGIDLCWLLGFLGAALDDPSKPIGRAEIEEALNAMLNRTRAPH